MLKVCKPPDGKAASSLTANPLLIQKRFKANFEEPIKLMLERLLSASPSERSPIIEAINSAVIEAFIGQQAEHLNPVRRMIIVSDMLQHSRLYSMYQQAPFYADFEKTLRKSEQSVPDLMGAEIEVLLLPRKSPKGDRADLVKFWTEFLTANGAGFGTSMETL